MKKYKRVEFRLTEQELERVTFKAEKAKFTIPAYAKKMTLNGKLVVYPQISDALFVRTQLKRIGNNINQYVRIANSNQSADEETTRKLSEQLTKCQRLLEDYIKPIKPDVWR